MILDLGNIFQMQIFCKICSLKLQQEYGDYLKVGRSIPGSSRPQVEMSLGKVLNPKIAPEGWATSVWMSI